MFEIVNNRQIIFGENKIQEIGGILKWYNKKKVFFAAFSKEAPAARAIGRLLEDAGIQYVVYDQVAGEPDLHMINGGNVEEYQMDGRQVTQVPPLFLAVPTTSGTGAEATKVSVVFNNYNGLKKSLYHTTMIADIVILDPTLTVSLPEKITVATGMDALSHAIESYVSLNASPLSEMYGLKAMELINGSLEQAVAHPDNLEARGNMMLGSYLGGCAITAGIGIAHIMAQPLGAMFHIPHGDACSIFLPAAMELNLPYAAEKYARIAQALGVSDSALSPPWTTAKRPSSGSDSCRRQSMPLPTLPCISRKCPRTRPWWTRSNGPPGILPAIPDHWMNS